MSFLPIVHRELRVASQRKGTYHLRAWAVALALCLVCYLWFSTEFGQFSSKNLGANILTLLSSILFGYTLLSGVFCTSDCIGVEKRSGTIGLLFLTRLKAYDITAGKLAAHSLQALYGLVAALPVMGLSMLFGGVTSEQFYWTALALLACLFLSLCVGLLASSMFRDARSSMSFTVLALGLVSFGFPLLREMLFPVASPVRNALAWASPFTLLQVAWSGGGSFWPSFWTILGLGAGSFVAASILTMRWRTELNQLAKPQTVSRARKVRRKASRAGDRRLLEENPFLWLASRATSRNRLLWILLIASSLCLFWMFFPTSRPSSWPWVGILVLYLLHVLFKIWVAVEACRQFYEDRKNGLLELLCVTPTPIEVLPVAYVRRLKKRFVPPAIFLAHLSLMFIGRVFWDTFSNPGLWWQPFVFYSAVCIGGAILLFLDLDAFLWTGLAAGLRHRKVNRAIFYTVAKIMGVSWLLMLVVAAGIVPGSSFGLGTAIILIWQSITAAIAILCTRHHRFLLRAKFRSFLDQLAKPQTVSRAGDRRLLEENPFLWLASRATSQNRLLWILLIVSSLCLFWMFFMWSPPGMFFLRPPPFWLTVGVLVLYLLLFLWLASRATSRNRLLWILLLWILLIASSFYLFWVLSLTPFKFWWSRVGALVLYLLHVLFKIWVAVEACRQFHEDRKNGFLELLCVTPTPIEALPVAYVRRLKKRFVPSAIFLAHLSLMVGWVFFDSTPRPPMVALPPLWWEFVSILAICIGGAILLFLDLDAFLWTGLAAGLRHRKLNRAIFYTVAKVMGVSWLLMFVVAGILVAGIMPRSFSGGPEIALILIWQSITAAIAIRCTRRHRFLLRAKFRSFLQYSV